MSYWLLKSEPETWSWNDQVRDGVAEWDGVRSFQAAKNLKAMVVGDQAFFYHSGKERQIVGLVEIVRTAYPDPSDPSGRFVMVDVKAKQTLPHPVSLAAIKQDPRMQQLALVRQSRLSVMPIDPESWEILLAMGQT
ncbi:MAG: EVE domain-containing protein [Pseudomonadota bacterium]